MFDLIAELFTERNEDTDYVKYHGDYEFWVEVKIQGDLPFQTSNIVLSCFKTSKKEVEVPFDCSWYRIIAGKNFEIKDNSGCHYYKCNPYDIGSKIKVVVRPTRGYAGDLAFVTFGPFELDPALKPYIEHNLLSCQGSFMINLLKYDRKDIVDNSDFNNVIEFQDTQLGIRFCDLFPELKDFSVDLETKGMTLKCDYDDPRMLTIYFKRGEEEAISASILVSKNHVSNLERRNRTYSRMKQSNLEGFISREEDGKSHFLAKDQKQGELEFVKNKNLLQEIDMDQLFELSIRFETRILRDVFITSLRFMRVKGALPLASIFDSVDVLLRKQWFPPDLEDRSHEYVIGCFELHSFRAILRRMLRINKNLSLENDNLNDCVDLLDGDLKSSAKEFDDLIEDLKRRKNTKPSDVQKYEQVEKSLLNTSYQIEKMRNSSRHDLLENRDKKKEKIKMKAMEAEKVIKMEKELASRKKLNGMLLKEIEKMKKKSKGNSSQKNKNLGGGDRTFNQQLNPFEDERLNRSVLDKKKEEKYLIGIEEDLRDNNNPFMKELEEEVSKAKNKLNMNEIKQIESIKHLEEDIALVKSRIEINKKAYKELLVLTSRINNGDTLEENETLYNQNIFGIYGVNNVKNISSEIMKNYLEQTKASILKIEESGENGNNEIVENVGQSRFTFGGDKQVFESHQLGESNLSNPFGTNLSKKDPENLDLNELENKELKKKLDDLKQKNLSMKNANESYGYQINESKERLTELLAQKKENKSEKKDDVVDLRKKNNNTKKLIQLRRAVRKLEADIEELEESDEEAEIQTFVQKKIIEEKQAIEIKKEEIKESIQEKKEAVENKVEEIKNNFEEKKEKIIENLPHFGFKKPEAEVEDDGEEEKEDERGMVFNFPAGEERNMMKKKSIEEVFDIMLDDSLHHENARSPFKAPRKETGDRKVNDDIEDLLSDGGIDDYVDDAILNEEEDRIRDSDEDEEEAVEVDNEIGDEVRDDGEVQEGKEGEIEEESFQKKEEEGAEEKKEDNVDDDDVEEKEEIGGDDAMVEEEKVSPQKEVEEDEEGIDDAQKIEEEGVEKEEKVDDDLVVEENVDDDSMIEENVSSQKEASEKGDEKEIDIPQNQAETPVEEEKEIQEEKLEIKDEKEEIEEEQPDLGGTNSEKIQEEDKVPEDTPELEEKEIKSEELKDNDNKKSPSEKDGNDNSKNKNEEEEESNPEEANNTINEEAPILE